MNLCLYQNQGKGWLSWPAFQFPPLPSQGGTASDGVSMVLPGAAPLVWVEAGMELARRRGDWGNPVRQVDLWGDTHKHTPRFTILARRRQGPRRQSRAIGLRKKAGGPKRKSTNERGSLL